MDLHNFLARLPIFKNLDSVALQELSQELGKIKLPSGVTLFSQGDPADAFYIITMGKLYVNVRSGADLETVSELGEGESIGEMALMTGQPRTATVIAAEDTELLCLEKSAFDRLLEKYPNLFSGLAAQLLPRFQRDQVHLALSRLFGKLDDGVFHDMLGQLRWRRIGSGQTLFHEGEVGDEMFIVVQGRLRFVKEEPGGCQRILGEVGAGECIGEFALLAEPGTQESLRTATVYATRMTDMVVIDRPAFNSLLLKHPQALLNLTRQIVRRSTVMARTVSPQDNHMVITLLPARNEPGIDEFAHQLENALKGIGPVLSLDAAGFDKLYGKPGISTTPLDHPLSLVINAWLDEREREHQFAVYVTAPQLDESGRLDAWTQRCVDDADLLLLVGEAGTSPALTPVERALSGTKTRSRLELVFVHPDSCQVPSGTAEWLAARRSSVFPVQTWHHVRLGNGADFRRLARRVAGKPVGLTLSGGGARGWAHVGILRFMEEAGLEFDWVAGASMGAIVAGGSALDWTSDRLCELAAQFSDPKKLLDYTFPYTSITATRRITNMLQTLYAGANIEDTWHPFFCVSANLNQGDERVHSSGPLWKAVRASMAFPGIFAPIADEGDVLIDGGAANNLPIDRMRERCPNGIVIGVDLITGSPVRGEYDFSPSLSGWQVLFSRISPFSRKVKVPSILNVIDGLVYGANRYRLNEVWRCADLLVKVPVQEYGLLEFDKYEQIAAAGYRAAQEQFDGFVLS